ncbi:hypothetical protein D3C71_2250090 [compost metagenome]
MFVRPRHAGGKMRVDVVGPAEQGGQAVGGGQFDPYLPLFGADPVAHLVGAGNDGRQ